MTLSLLMLRVIIATKTNQEENYGVIAFSLCAFEMRLAHEKYKNKLEFLSFEYGKACQNFYTPPSPALFWQLIGNPIYIEEILLWPNT